MTEATGEAGDEFIPVAQVGDIPPGAMKCVALDGQRVLVANVDGRFFAVSDICGHRNAPLSRGRLAGHVVECPLHFAQFDVRSGKLIDGPISADLPTYEVRVDDESILLKR